jgi:hypothetical protein
MTCKFHDAVPPNFAAKNFASLAKPRSELQASQVHSHRGGYGVQTGEDVMHSMYKAVVLDDRVGGAKHRIEEQLAGEVKLVSFFFAATNEWVNKEIVQRESNEGVMWEAEREGQDMQREQSGSKESSRSAMATQTHATTHPLTMQPTQGPPRAEPLSRTCKLKMPTSFVLAKGRSNMSPCMLSTKLKK